MRMREFKYFNIDQNFALVGQNPAANLRKYFYDGA